MNAWTNNDTSTDRRDVCNTGGTACLLCALTSGGLQRIWGLAGRFGAASAMSLTQLYLTELLSTDVQHAALVAASQVCMLAVNHSLAGSNLA